MLTSDKPGCMLLGVNGHTCAMQVPKSPDVDARFLFLLSKGPNFFFFNIFGLDNMQNMLSIKLEHFPYSVCKNYMFPCGLPGWLSGKQSAGQCR